VNAILLTPEFVILAAGLVVLIWDIFLPPEKKHVLGWFALLAAAAGFAATFMPELQTGSTDAQGAFTFVGKRALNGSFVMDPLALFMKRCFAVCGVLLFLMTREYVASLSRGRGEFYALSLFALFGMFLTASVNDFMSLFVALETVTVTFFILVAYKRDEPKSIEAGLKLLVIGSLSAAILVYGIAFIYGATGTLNFDVLRAALADKSGGVPSSSLAALLFGAILVFLGLGFKASALPLHVWVPDVYEGAPTPVTAFLSVGSKLAGFALVLRVFLTFSGDAALSESLGGFFALIAAMTLFYGNLGALPQSNLKRLMGYSSIGQCGYILIGIAAGWRTGFGGVLFYMAAYVLTNMVAFVVILLVGRAVGSHEIRDYKGLAKRSPLLALTLTAALLSLAGVPPFLGFFGKFMLLGSAFGVESLRWLVIVGLVNVIIAMYYYLSVIRQIYVDEPKNPTAPEIPTRLGLMMTISVIALVVGGMAPLLLERPVTAVTNTLPVPVEPR
jgi:NADH-quinone oxidoreductase subunit N